MTSSAGILDFLVSVGARSLILFGSAAFVLAAFRVRAAAARHAVWTVVAVGMLCLAALSPALPPLPLHWLKAASFELAQLPAPPSAGLGTSAPVAPTLPPRPRFAWQDAAVAAYVLIALALAARLAFGYLFTRRLLRAATPVDRFPDTWSSSWISVPMTVGRKVLLPPEWVDWEETKLAAVLAHERTHVARGDWAIALLAGFVRSLFWFQPLAWWLERRLASLAEEACDDSALLLVESGPYAQALLEMAAAVQTAQGRLIWEAMAMAKAGEVRKRIERILDETRQIPRAVSRVRWAALIACSLPLIWVASVAQLVPAAAQENPKTPAAMAEFLKGRRQLTPGDVATMEQYLAANPHDVDVRSQVILYYYSIGVREPRLTHIVWLIENHPEAPAAAFASTGVLPRDSSTNSFADYQRVQGAWRNAIAARQHDPAVLGNAAQFFEATGQLDTAEQLLLAAKNVQGGNPNWKSRLGKLYALAILETTGDAKFPATMPAFSSRVRSEMPSSEDGNLLFETGTALMFAAQRPEPGRPLPTGVLNLDEHPLLEPAVQLGQQLVDRAVQFGGPRLMKPMIISRPNASGYVVGGGVAPREGIVGAVPSGVPGGTPGGVLGGIIGSAPSGGPPTPRADIAWQPTPPIVKKVEPEYPALAWRARISGVVKLAVGIGPDGTVRHIEVLSGHPLLIAASLEAVKQWVFQGSGATVQTSIDVPFVLPPGPPPEALNAAGAPQQAAPSMIKVGGNVQAAKLIERVQPNYPPQARADGIEGSVTVSLTIAEDGHVEAAQPIDGNPALAGAAVEAVRQWRYQPTLLNGNPVKVMTTTVVEFRLR